MIPKPYSQHLRQPDLKTAKELVLRKHDTLVNPKTDKSSSSQEGKKEKHATIIDSKKDKPKPVKHSTRPKHHKVKVCGQGSKELNKTLVECLDNFKWPQSTTCGHVLFKGS